MGTEVSPDAVLLHGRASRAALAPRCPLTGGCSGRGDQPSDPGRGKERRGQCHSPAGGSGCPSLGASSHSGLFPHPRSPCPFPRLVKVKWGLKCYSHRAYFAGAQNILFLIKALLNSKVPAGAGSLQAPVQDGRRFPSCAA